MTIESSWFNEAVLGWSDDIEWLDADLLKATDILKEVAEINGAEIAWDKNKSDFPNDMAQRYAKLRVGEAIQRRMNRYHAQHFPSQAGLMKQVEGPDAGPTLPFLKQMIWSKKTNINLARKNELVNLPRIGEVLANRIIEYRLEKGPISKLEQLLDVVGVNPGILEEIQDLVTTSFTEGLYFTSSEAEAFRNEPTFQSYIRWMVAANGSFLRQDFDGLSPTEMVLNELMSIRDEVKADPSPRGRTLGFTRATEANALLNLYDSDDMVGGVPAEDTVITALLYDSGYRNFVESLIDTSTDQILVIMFFFKFEDERSYPTDVIVQKLIDAKSRGVDVKVLLDRDAEGDKYGSRVINKNVKTYLSNAGIAVKMDRPEILTHAKTLIVDQKHVVVGSHNWTAGSFYTYDDTSIYLESVTVAENLTAIFDVIWDNAS